MTRLRMARRGAVQSRARDGLASGTAIGLTILVMASMLIMGGALPAFGQPRLLDDGVIQTSVPGATGPQETYRSRVRDEMAEWRRKMQAFDNTFDAGGKRERAAAEARLRSAWDDTEVEARNVLSATGAATDVTWARTKRSYEAASRRMAAAWDRVRL